MRTFLLFAGGVLCMLTLDLSFGVVVACALPLIQVNNVMQENVSGARVVKAYVKEEYEEERRDVSFSYAGMAGERVIDHINLTISPGETFGILGATGCGFYRRDGPGQDHRERQS